MRRALKLVAVLFFRFCSTTGLALAGLYEVSQSPDYCRWCHVMDPYVRSWESSDFLAHAHYRADVTCQTCHPQTMTDLLNEIVAMVRESYFVPLPRTPDSLRRSAWTAMASIRTSLPPPSI